MCHTKQYDYMLPARHGLHVGSKGFVGGVDADWVVREVTDRAAFLVAIWAYAEGEFYLDEGMPDRGKLRGELIVFVVLFGGVFFLASPSDNVDVAC